MKLACPYCEAMFEVDSFSGGRKFQCGGCGKKFLFAGGSSFRYGVFTAPALPGMDRLVCPGCGGCCDIVRGIKHDSLTSCSVCRTTFAVPKGAPEPPPPEPETAAPELPDGPDDALPPFEMKEGIGGNFDGVSSGTKCKLAAAVLLLILLLVGVALLVAKAFSR